MPALADAAPNAADDDDLPPPPETAADRFRGVRLVGSALSERMVAKLQAAGIDVDGAEKLSSLSSSAMATEEVGAEDQLISAAARCAQLGLSEDAQQRARLPLPSLGAPRLPVCVFEPTLGGLWQKFRQRCGTPVPADAALLPCELRPSRGGGHVVVPVVSS